MYVADYNNNRIRKVTVSTGIITTIAGTGTGSYSGDNGPATSATINRPYGVTLDASGTPLFAIYFINFCLLATSKGNMFIGDEFNHRIRKVSVSTGIITTFAGSGTTDYSGDNGQATSAALYYPLGVALDTTGIRY